MAEVLGGPAESPGTPGEHAPARDDAARAVTALFRDHHLELARLALLMVGDLATAEDVRRWLADRGHACGFRHG